MAPLEGQTRVVSPKAALARLVRIMPPHVREVLRTLGREGQVVVVGGAVRDVFLGRPIPDWDLATSLLPAQVAAMFPRVSRAGEKHGTIMVLTQGGPVEVTTFRGEGAYLDGRRPSSVVFHANVEADLARRDFTINAMAADLGAGAIVDPFGGADDLRRRRIRTVGDAAARFAEDGLRPLRAVRFAAVLEFALAKSCERALTGALSTFAKVAWERRRDEMERLLAGAKRLSLAMRVLQRSGMLGELAPELKCEPSIARRVERLATGRPWLRLAAWGLASTLAPGELATLFDRWRVAAAARDAAIAQAQAVLALGKAPPVGRQLRAWAASAGRDHIESAALLAQALKGGGFEKFPRQVKGLLKTGVPLAVRDLPVSGEDLLLLGFAGKAVGEALRALLAAVIADPSANERNTLLRLAHSLSTTHCVKTAD